MHKAPIPEGDAQRVALMREFDCAFTPREERFDRITRLARKLLEVPICTISIIDQDDLWFLSEQGINAAHIRRESAICSHAIVQQLPLLVKDTQQDPRFCDSPIVLGPPFVRAYGGVPLEIEPGLMVGVLCVADTTPRQFSREELQSLQDLAAMVVAEIRLRPSPGLRVDFLRDLSHEERLALIDEPTGCWNVDGYSVLLRKLDAQSTAKSVSLTALHVPALARFEVLFGRKADLVLSSLAQQIRRQYSELAVFCRPSDDVFAIIIEQTAHALDTLHLPQPPQLAPVLQQMQFEVLLPSFPRAFEITATCTSQHILLPCPSAALASQTWRNLCAKLPRAAHREVAA